MKTKGIHLNTQYAHNLKLLERDGTEYYQSKNQRICLQSQEIQLRSQWS